MLLVFGSLWLSGCSEQISKWLFENGLIEDDYRYGDLYRMANLPQFKKLKDVCFDEPTEPKPNINLYLAGDSFTEKGRIRKENFHTNTYTWMHVAEKGSINLNPNQKNILVIETVERHFRERFMSPWRGISLENKTLPEKWYQKLLNWRLPYNTERHEAVLFSNELSLKIREWKALLNLKVFGRTAEQVYLNKTGQHIVYALDIKPGVSSIFDNIPQAAIDTLVSNVNNTVAYYQYLGFDEVIVSIIPNKSSLLASDLGQYNYLCKRIENNPKLKAKMISLYDDFRKSPEQYYELGDTHWSCKGRALWINKLNAQLNESNSFANSSAELRVATSF